MPPFARKRVVLTPEQRAMYRDEKVTNFRLVSSLVASYAPDTLGPDHLASAETQQYLSEIGAYAELAYSLLPIETVFKHLHVLLEPEFPLEGYPAEGLLNTSVVCSFVGRTADLPGFVAYRSDCRQLVVAISGTNVDSAVQALYDIRTLPHRHPSGRGKVHTGFWRLYKGIRDAALKGLKQGLRDFDVAEVVLCGHSMGSAVSQLLVLDLLHDDSLIGSVPMRFVGFGGPRVGTKGLVNLWRELVAKRRRRHGEHSFEEYAVKMHRDGVPVLPPKAFGYRHCVERPYYSRHGRLYHVPAHLGEYALFHVDETAPPSASHTSSTTSFFASSTLSSTSTSTSSHSDPIPLHPRGGHNYYSNRSMEQTARSIRWFRKALLKGEDQLRDAYMAKVEKHTRKPLPATQ